MALFQTDPHSDHQHQPLYSVGVNKTMLIVGLGNIGKQYEETRHNIGFVCLDNFAKAHDFDKWIEKSDLDCLMTTKILGETRTILCKPTTLMNLSGESVQKISHFYKINNRQIFVVHDELDIDYGQIRTRQGGSDAGNNGIKSIISHIGSDFGRIRVGIGGNKPEKMQNADYVLAKFTSEERSNIPTLEREVTSILTELVFSGQLPNDTRNFIS